MTRSKEAASSKRGFALYFTFLDLHFPRAFSSCNSLETWRASSSGGYSRIQALRMTSNRAKVEFLTTIKLGIVNIVTTCNSFRFTAIHGSTTARRQDYDSAKGISIGDTFREVRLTFAKSLQHPSLSLCPNIAHPRHPSE